MPRLGECVLHKARVRFLGLGDAELGLRHKLDGRREHPGRFEQHIWPTDLIETATAPGQLAPRMNEYLFRAVDMYVVHNGKRGFTLAKMGRLCCSAWSETTR